MQFRILGTRSKKKELETLSVHEKGTIQNRTVGWVRDKTESTRLGTSKEEEWTKKTIKWKLWEEHWLLNQEPARYIKN